MSNKIDNFGISRSYHLSSTYLPATCHEGYRVTRKNSRNQDQIEHLAGNYFLLSNVEFPYFHSLREQLGQYELLSSEIESLKLLVIVDILPDEVMEDEKLLHGSNLSNSFFDFVKKHYNYETIDVSQIESVEIEKIFYVVNDYLNGSLKFESYISVDDIFKSHGVEGVIEFERSISSSLRAKFSEYVKPVDFNKKTYLSRMAETLQAEAIKADYYSYKKDGTRPSDKFLTYIFETMDWNVDARKHYEMTIKRALSVEDTEELEAFFESQGYEIVDPSTLSIEDQISLYSSAGTIASIVGGGLTNTLFCSADTTVIAIVISTEVGLISTNCAAGAGCSIKTAPSRVELNSDIVYNSKQLIEFLKDIV